MQLNITTDYAIRIILALASKEGEVVSSKEISITMNIPQKYVLKIARNLVAANLIERRSGVYGGFLLAKPASEITVLDVVSVMEPTIRINRCLEDDSFCSRLAIDSCPLRKFYNEFQTIIEDNFSKITIQSLLNNK